MTLSLSYSRNTFAYSVSNGHIYIRRFSLTKSDTQLLATLNGQGGEVTQVREGGRQVEEKRKRRRRRRGGRVEREEVTLYVALLLGWGGSDGIPWRLN